MLASLKKLPKDAVYDTMTSPIGDLLLVACPKGLYAIFWQTEWVEEDWDRVKSLVPKDSKQKFLVQTRLQLKEYFQGKRKDFDIPLVVDGTVFQKQAWDVLRKIPYGETICYQDQARALGDINKVRAVGGANGKNSIPIIVPCHRVVAKSGGLGGFTGGLKIKEFLLELESSHA